MFIPFISSSSNKRLFRRKGGGGGGRGGGSSGGGDSGGSSGGGSSSGGSRGGTTGGSSGGSTGARSSVPISGSTGGRNSATAYGAGGGKVTSIPSGQLFAGRTEGGGSRDQVFGTRTYGSGYPGFANQRGVNGLGFPFYFWPLVWGGAAFSGAHYLNDNNEYGDANNSSRPGGPLMTATFASNSTNTTFHLIADNSTTISLVSSITTNCTSFLATNASSNFTPQLFNPNATNSPKPEQVVQYYRASSVSLTLDGYNDTAALSDNANGTDTPLPSGIDTNLLDCLNQTIGLAAPLIDGAPSLVNPVHSMGAMGLLWVIWCLVSMF